VKGWWTTLAVDTELIKRRYNRTATFYDLMDCMISPALKKKVIGRVRGDVLEVGVGTGANLPFYPPGCRVTGIDFSPAMLARAKKKAEAMHLPVTLLEMDVENLRFPDRSFDTVVATCVFCSVPDPVRGLAEIGRVCKADGQIILLEHVRSANPVIGKIMDILNPLSVNLIGSNINRDTLANIEKAGLEIKSVEDYTAKLIKLVAVRP
jgi:ubiquinone/menaquinone biosynthesis C-methylase UbiE